MSKLLYRLGSNAARRPWRVVAVWIVVAIAVLGLQMLAGGETVDELTLPGTEAQAGQDLLLDKFASEGGASGMIVFADPDGDITDAAARSAVAATRTALAEDPRVVAVSDPYGPHTSSVSDDGRVAFATIRYDVSRPGSEEADAAMSAVEVARNAGLQAELTGEIVNTGEDEGGSEVIGLLVALVVLLVAFGSIIAAGIPIATVVAGSLVGLALVAVMAGVTDVPSVSPLIASMIGIGVGIDYSLFVVTRYRESLGDGVGPVAAVGQANATAGTAVVFAGSTVVVALLGLTLAGIPSVATMGYASAITVTVAMFAAVTLIPAFLGLAGSRIDRWAIQRNRPSGPSESKPAMAARWADHVGRHPWRHALVSLVGLLAITLPALDMRTGFADDGTAATDHTSRLAYDLLADGFGPGFNAPITIAVDAGVEGPLEGPDLERIRQALLDTPGVAAVEPPATSAAGDVAVVTAYPDSSPSSPETKTLIQQLRNDVLPAAAEPGTEILVTGQTAAFIDISDKLASRLPTFVATVVGLSFILLVLVFRSIVVPAKAAAMNLLSIGGAYGLVVAVFQWGWGNELIGLDTTVPISPFLPMIMFAILFGLSMDYEVFLLTRIREEYLRTSNNHDSVVNGLAATARVITSAAIIMISVFAAFIASPDVEVKMFAIGLAAAVAIDATVVRMILVPSAMALMGSANWWFPRWLDDHLPRLDIDGTHHADTIPDNETEPDGPPNRNRPATDLVAS